jgi:hypothetical protein
MRAVGLLMNRHGTVRNIAMASKKKTDNSSLPPMTGLYNIQPSGDPYEHHQSVPKLPPISTFEPECISIANALRIAIDRYLKSHAFPTHSDLLEEIFGRDSIGEFPSDRTMCFFVDHLDVFTPEFVHLLQAEVLSKFPLWRLLAQYSGKTIGIYPTGTWLGAQCIEGPFDATHPAYRDWLNDAKAYDEARFGPRRRQLRHVRKLIPTFQAAAKTQGVAVVAVFGGYDPLFPVGPTVWLLQCMHPHRLRPVPECGEMRTSAVSDAGEIYSQFCKDFTPYTDMVPPYWLATYLLPDTDRHELRVKDSAGEIDVRFVLDGSVSDAQLSADERKTK